jgi:hypothetical protein
MSTFQGKSAQDPISTNKKLGMEEHTCHPSYVGSLNRRIMVHAVCSINQFEKITEGKGLGYGSSGREPA